MKKLVLSAVILFFMASCGNNGAGNTEPQTNASTTDSLGTAAGQPDSSLRNSADSTALQGQQTDRIPSRTGTTGQGNTTVTGTATGAPVGKDTSKSK